MQLKNKFGGLYRLKSFSLIKQVFKEGREVVSFPIKVKYINITEDTYQYTVAVSKKKFKRAVDRNKVKRLLRAALLEEGQSHSGLQSKAVIFMYIGSKLLPYSTLVGQVKNILNELEKDN